METAPVANFHRAAARCSCTSGCGERFSKGRTSCAGSRTTWAGFDGAGEFAAGPQHGFQFLRGFVVGDEDDYRLTRCTRNEWDVESPRRRGEPGYTSPPRTKAQMPSYALKSGRVLQLREDFADERENHVIPV